MRNRTIVNYYWKYAVYKKCFFENNTVNIGKGENLSMVSMKTASAKFTFNELLKTKNDCY